MEVLLYYNTFNRDRLENIFTKCGVNALSSNYLIHRIQSLERLKKSRDLQVSWKTMIEDRGSGMVEEAEAQPTRYYCSAQRHIGMDTYRHIYAS